MNINKNTLFSLVVAGIIAGSAVGYSGYNYHLKKNTVIKQEAALAKFSEEDMASMASFIVEGKILNISETRWRIQLTESNHCKLNSKIYNTRRY